MVIASPDSAVSAGRPPPPGFSLSLAHAVSSDLQKTLDLLREAHTDVETLRAAPQGFKTLTHHVMQLHNFPNRKASLDKIKCSLDEPWEDGVWAAMDREDHENAQQKAPVHLKVLCPGVQ